MQTTQAPSRSFCAKDNQIFDKILEARRSIRQFTGETPSKDAIEAVLQAGLLAPYGGLANTDNNDFRRFFIFSNKSTALEKLDQIIRKDAAQNAAKLELEMKGNQFLKKTAGPFLGMLSQIAQNGIPGLLQSPCCMVVAERRSTPPVEKQALAHTMQNIWLKATALGLGVRLLSAVSMLSENEEFCALLELPVGAFAFDCCIIGYAAHEPAPRVLPERHVRWL